MKKFNGGLDEEDIVDMKETGMDKPKHRYEESEIYKAIKSRPDYPSEDLKEIETLLIKLISSTTHAAALGNLTRALCEVRQCNSNMEEYFFYGDN